MNCCMKKSLLFLLVFVPLFVSCGIKNGPEAPVEPEVEYPLSREGVKLLFADEIVKYHAVFLSKQMIAPNTVYNIGTFQLCGDSFLVEEVVSPSDSSWLLLIDHDVYLTADGRSHWEFRFIRAKDGTYMSSMHEMLPEPTVEYAFLDEYEFLGKPPKNKSSISTKATSSGARISGNDNTKWGVIINGGYNMYNNHVRYWNDCSAMYKCLVHNYNFPAGQVFVIMADGLSPLPDRHHNDGSYDSSPVDLDGDGYPDIQYSATMANISVVFDYLGSVVQSGDDVMVFVSDHGGLGMGNSTFACLWNGDIMYDWQFANELVKISSEARVHVLLAQCNSGGFIDDISRGNITVAASCQADESAYALFSDEDSEYNHSVFPYQWVCAMRRYDDNNDPSSADSINNGEGYFLGNGNGEVSFAEAFHYAEWKVSSHNSNQHPQYLSNPQYLGDFCSLYGLNVNLAISGPTNVLSTELYTITDVPSGYTVVWSSVGNLTISPLGNSVRVTNNSDAAYEWAMLRASVSSAYRSFNLSMPVCLWNSGIFFQADLISGTFSECGGSFNLVDYPVGCSGFHWDCDGYGVEFVSQGGTIVDYIVHDEYQYPDNIWVDFINPFGDDVTIVKQLR